MLHVSPHHQAWWRNVKYHELSFCCSGQQCFLTRACVLFLCQNGPELLPRVGMLQLLTQVVATSTPRLQVHTQNCTSG